MAEHEPWEPVWAKVGVAVMGRDRFEQHVADVLNRIFAKDGESMPSQAAHLPAGYAAWYEAPGLIGVAPADALLPPDPDAFGSLHWLEYRSATVWPAMWCRMSASSDQPHFRPLSPESRHVATADLWRYHSQMTIPAPLGPPADPDVERMWAAVQDLGQR